MAKEFYFKSHTAEICYNEEYFQNYMNEYNIEKMEVFKAMPIRVSGVFWCKQYQAIGSNDYSSDGCGKHCKDYAPRNGKSGCCKHHSSRLYEHGEKTTLIKQ